MEEGHIYEEEISVTMSAGTDYVYIPFRLGWHLVSAYGADFSAFTNPQEGLAFQDDYIYVVFFRNTATEDTAFQIALTWLNNAYQLS